MRISVALCTYNGARFLPAQLDSLLAQTRLPDEIIACDDASHDSSMALLTSFSAHMRERGVHVQLIQRHENLGYILNFSDALCRTSGDVVFLCDQDDFWHAERIARMAAEFARRPSLQLLHTDADLTNAEGRSLGYTLFEALEFTSAERKAEHNGHAFNTLLRRNTVTGATAAFRRNLIEYALPVPEGWIHDEWLAICGSLQGDVDFLDWSSIEYRQHGNNQIGIRRRSFWKQLNHQKISKRDYMRKMVCRLQYLAQQHQDGRITFTPQQIRAIHNLIMHAQFRGNLAASLLPRTHGILTETLTGRYWRYSNGMRSILGDLLEWN